MENDCGKRVEKPSYPHFSTVDYLFIFHHVERVWITFVEKFLCAGRANAEDVLRHVDHGVQACGLKNFCLGTDYFGCILGDASRLGANSVTQPGTHIGPHSWVYPLTNVRGFIPKETRVYQKVDLAFEENEVVELKP